MLQMLISKQCIWRRTIRFYPSYYMQITQAFSQNTEGVGNDTQHPRKEEFHSIEEKVKRMDEEGGYYAVGGCNQPSIESVNRTVTEAVSKALHAKDQVDDTSNEADQISYAETQRKIERILEFADLSVYKSSEKKNEPNSEQKEKSLPETDAAKLAKEQCSTKTTENSPTNDKKLQWKAGISVKPQ